MRRASIPAASVPCDDCPNCLMPSEATLSRRALGAVLCWCCRLHARPRPTVHQVPPGCSALVSGTGYGLWSVTVRTADGREFSADAMADHLALSRALAAARVAGAITR